MNMGEELVSDYLQFIKECEFVQKNLYTKGVQGEIDVVGINLQKKIVYICEVAVHLETGLKYVRNNQPNNVSKLVDKFTKDIKYAQDHFSDYERHFMLWSPIVKDAGKKAKNNQLNDVEIVKEKIKQLFQVDIEAIINEEFLNKLNELKKYAVNETKEIKSAVARLYQIEEKTKAHVDKLNSPKKTKSNP